MFEITEELLTDLTHLKGDDLKIFYLKYKQYQSEKGNVLTSFLNYKDFKTNILNFLKIYNTYTLK